MDSRLPAHHVASTGAAFTIGQWPFLRSCLGVFAAASWRWFWVWFPWC